MAKKNGAKQDAGAEKPQERWGVTLTLFQRWQIESLVGIYAASPPEVLRRAVLEWLQEHHTEIEQQKRDHERFLSETRKMASPPGTDLE